MSGHRLADPSNLPRTVKTGVGRGGWKYTDEVYAALWLERVNRTTVIDANGCWLWQGFTNPIWGYAQTNFRGKQVRIHRKAYEIAHKVVLARDQYVCHSCDVRHCWNVEHLWVGTNSENQKDSGRKGRHAESSKTHCQHGHEFTPDNTRYYECRPGQISRSCRTCARIRCRLRNGWTPEEAALVPIIPAGHSKDRRL